MKPSMNYLVYLLLQSIENIEGKAQILVVLVILIVREMSPSLIEATRQETKHYYGAKYLISDIVKTKL